MASVSQPQGLRHHLHPLKMFPSSTSTSPSSPSSQQPFFSHFSWLAQVPLLQVLICRLSHWGPRWQMMQFKAHCRRGIWGRCRDEWLLGRRGRPVSVHFQKWKEMQMCRLYGSGSTWSHRAWGCLTAAALSSRFVPISTSMGSYCKAVDWYFVRGCCRHSGAPYPETFSTSSLWLVTTSWVFGGRQELFCSYYTVVSDVP